MRNVSKLRSRSQATTFAVALVVCAAIGGPAAFAGKGGKPGGGTKGVPDPTNLAVTGTTESQIDLSWASGGGTTAGFLLSYQMGSAPADCTGGINLGMATTQSVTGLSSSMTYGFRVCAYDASNSASPGVTVTGTTKSPPPPTPANQVWLGNPANMSAFSQYVTVAYDPVYDRVYSGGFQNGSSGTDRLGVIEARNAADGSFATAFRNGTLLVNSDNSSSENTHEFITAIDTDSQGNVYACGNGCIGGDCAATGTGKNLVPSDKWGYVIYKFSPTGQKIWELGAFEIPGDVNEQCDSLEVKNENGTEYVYAQGFAGGNVALLKADTNRNVIWTKTIDDGGTENNSPASDSLEVSDNAVYTVYGTNNTPTGEWQIVLRKLDLNGQELGMTTRSFLNFHTLAINIQLGKWNGADYLWMTPYHDNRVYRYDLNLNLAPSTEDGLGCHDLDLSPFAHHILPYDLLTVNEGGVDYLYVPARLHPQMGSSDYDAVIMRFKMTADSCDSDNEAGELFDIATHRYNFGDSGVPDGFLAIDRDGNNDIYVTGYQGVVTSDYRGVTIKYRGR